MVPAQPRPALGPFQDGARYYYPAIAHFSNEQMKEPAPKVVKLFGAVNLHLGIVS
jgi:hypothetical protein